MKTTTKSEPPKTTAHISITITLLHWRKPKKHVFSSSLVACVCIHCSLFLFEQSLNVDDSVEVLFLHFGSCCLFMDGGQKHRAKRSTNNKKQISDINDQFTHKLQEIIVALAFELKMVNRAYIRDSLLAFSYFHQVCTWANVFFYLFISNSPYFYLYNFIIVYCWWQMFSFCFLLSCVFVFFFSSLLEFTRAKEYKTN